MASNLGDKFSTLHEIVRAARNNLAPGAWDYLMGGEETETTLKRNRLALDSIAFRPRVLRDVSEIYTTSTLFGRPVRLPLMLAPIDSIETFAYGGGVAAAARLGHVKRFKDTHFDPLGPKGIGTAEDATLAVQHGVEGGYVSKQGGRQLDHGRGAIQVLPEVVRTVGGRATVLVDGGFMRGTDVVKALALGAQSVGIGRLACCGLAAAGQAGLVRVLELLEDEIRIAMGLLGVDRLAALDPSHLHPATPVGPARATSAFPLLDEEGY